VLFALFIASYSPTPADHGVRREWLVRLNGGQYVLGRDFERAKRMPLAEALEAYRTVDSPILKLGLVPLED